MPREKIKRIDDLKSTSKEDADNLLQLAREKKLDVIIEGK